MRIPRTLLLAGGAVAVGAATFLVAPLAQAVSASLTATFAQTSTWSSGSIVDVSTAAQLSAAMANARPGQTIRLAPGTYDGSFIGTTPGTATAPITVTGPRTAILTNPAPAGSGPSCPVPTPGWDPGYGVWIADAPYWNLVGFTVANAKKGVVVDNSPHVTIDGLDVHHIGDEGVHFRRSSSDGVIKNSTVEYASNTVRNATTGLTNIAVTP